MRDTLTPIVTEHFLSTFDELENYAISAEFKDQKNDIDGVIYPFICNVIPERVKAEVNHNLYVMLNRAPENQTLFMRRSPAGVSVPHIAHTDNSMGKFSLMLYLNNYPDCGTAFLKHKETGCMHAPESQTMVDRVSKDQNDLNKWDIMHTVYAKKNRVCIFDAGYFHCAIPAGGFSDGNRARTVLTCFFS